MKDISNVIHYKDKEYKLVFNLNVMEKIQEEYGTVDKWGEMTDGTVTGEPDAKAVIFGFREMINEGIDISNEENGEKTKFLSLKQVGRLITEVGLKSVTDTINKTVIDSINSDEKNA